MILDITALNTVLNDATLDITPASPFDLLLLGAEDGSGRSERI